MKKTIKTNLDSTLSQPFIRWAGSKRQHLPLLKSFWSDTFSRYVEPFAGSAILFFNLNPARALLGDINKELISTFKTVRDHPTQVHKTLKAIPKGPIHYKRVRKENLERAARFIYLNRFCFNGLYRTNLKGEFNVPYGGKRSGSIPTQEHLIGSARHLKRATLFCGDFQETLSKVRRGDFVYLDPPYAVSNRRIFTEYGEKPFTVPDIEVLGKLLSRIDRKGAKFVLSYADCSEARKAFVQWKTKRVLTRRSVAGFHGARRNAYELCVTNLTHNHALHKDAN